MAFAAVRNTYDNVGRLVKVEQGELSAWQSQSVAPASWIGFTILTTVDYQYNGMGSKVRETVSNGGTVFKVTQYSYDSVGRLECTAVRMNPSTWGSLPASACTMTATSASGEQDRITKNIWFQSGKVKEVRKAVGTTIEQVYSGYTYTPNEKIKTIVDANGNRATYEYDGYDRLIAWRFPGKTNGTVSAACNLGAISEVGGITGPADARSASDDCEKYSYDRNGNRAKLVKRDGSVLTYQYDALNRNTVKIVPERAGLAATHTRDVYYAYDLRGLLTSARFDSASGEGLVSAYDGFGRMSSSTFTMDGVARTLTYNVDKGNNRTQFTFPDGNYFGFGYDGLHRMTAIGRNAASGLTGFGYNNRGLRSSLASGSWTYYGYDGIGRLNSLTQDIAGTPSDVTYTYGYNPASQIVTRTTGNDSYVYTGDVNVNRNYSVNGLNQYTAAGPASFSYDLNGNLTGDGPNAYVYDVENRLVSASGATTASLRYDPLGRLYETSGGAAGITRFLHDGDELVAEYNSSGIMLRRYVHGTSVDDPMAWFEGTGVADSAAKLIKTNHQGSVIALTDWYGNMLGINTYDDYGIPGTSNLGRFQYTGQAWIPELRMYYYKARIYSPTLGRFLQIDPIGYDDQVNLYAYVGNDPLNSIDPTGKQLTKSCDANSCTYTAENTNLLGALLMEAAAAIWNVGVGIHNAVVSESPATNNEPVKTTPTAVVNSNNELPITVYRLHGGISGPLGHSWTPIDPRNIPNPRDALGLPDGNTATSISTGQLVDVNGVTVRSALPLHGNRGGAPEFLVPEPAVQIQGIATEPFVEDDNK